MGRLRKSVARKRRVVASGLSRLPYASFYSVDYLKGYSKKQVATTLSQGSVGIIHGMTIWSDKWAN